MNNFHSVTDKHPVLDGIAAGDALGLPYEGTKPKSIKWGFFGVWGVTSDDTQHAHIAFRALRECRGDAAKFRSLLAEYIAQWFCCISPGIGLGTLKASLKLCAGLEAPHSAAWSEGNGPLPRAALLGWEMGKDPRLEYFVDISTTTTHSGGAARGASPTLANVMAELRHKPCITDDELYEVCRRHDNSREWMAVVARMRAAGRGDVFLRGGKKSNGVSGHAYETLAVALLVAMRWRGDLEAALRESVLIGGDTDSVAALVGALCAAMGGEVPNEWRKIVDWPIRTEPSVARVAYNLITFAGILFWHLPIRVWARVIPSASR